MSPGRWAAPSGMFSTRPMAPTTLALALRLASACIRPTTQAAPAMSPFMSSMPAAGLSEMPPESKQTPLPMKATGCASFAPPFQRITTTRLGRIEPWPTPSSAPMPSRSIAGTSRISTSTPSFSSPLAFSAKDFGIKLVGRQIDQRAGEIDAVGEAADLGQRGGKRARVGAGHAEVERTLRILVVLLALLRLELVEFVGAQPQAKREIRGGLFEIGGRGGEIEENGGAFRLAELGYGEPAESQVIDLFAFLFRRRPEYDQPLRGEAGWGENVERGADFAFESGYIGRARDERRRISKRLPGRGAEDEGGIGEDDQRLPALFGRGGHGLLNSDDADGDGP